MVSVVVVAVGVSVLVSSPSSFLLGDLVRVGGRRSDIEDSIVDDGVVDVPVVWFDEIIALVLRFGRQIYV